mgnify:CR=1 FL=1
MAEVPISDAAQSLYVDPTPAYQPALDFVEKQRTQANERYAQNKADITNMFGTLTQVNQESAARVNSQFQTTIADQQMAVANRAAAARTGMAQTAASAEAAANERGGGPAANLAASPAAIAGERGIADMNSRATIWEGQQGAIQGQTQQNLAAALQGYGFQQSQATQGLQRNLEDVLLGLSGQEANIRGDLAGAEISGQQAVRQANYQQILQRQAEAAAARVAEANAANQPRQYSSGATGIFERIADEAGEESSVAFSQSIADILAGGKNDFKGFPFKSDPTPTSLSDAMKLWINANPKLAPYYQGYASEVFADILSKTIPSGSSSTQQTPDNFFGAG